MQYLKVNPIVTTSHYQYYFDCPERTASRYHNRDKIIDKVRQITFQHFYKLYGGFPCPKFKPQWLSLQTD